MSDGVDTPETHLKLHAAQPGAEAADGEAAPAGSAPKSDPGSNPESPAPEAIVEAVLFASDTPLKPAKIAEIAGLSGVRDVKQHVAQLNRKYGDSGASFRIEHIADGFQMLTLSVYNPWLGKLLRVRQETRLSQAALETLAIVAYKQPILRADVEAIRGVACGEMLNRLRELNLIKIVGRAEDMGRPILYGTSRRFLEVFGLASLEDLPETEALKPPE